MMTRRLFCVRFLPAVVAAPLAQWPMPEREPKTEQEKHNDKVDGEIFYLLYSDRIQNTRLEMVEGQLLRPGHYEAEKPREIMTSYDI